MGLGGSGVCPRSQGRKWKRPAHLQFRGVPHRPWGAWLGWLCGRQEVPPAAVLRCQLPGSRAGVQPHPGQEAPGVEKPSSLPMLPPGLSLLLEKQHKDPAHRLENLRAQPGIVCTNHMARLQMSKRRKDISPWLAARPVPRPRKTLAGHVCFPGPLPPCRKISTSPPFRVNVGPAAIGLQVWLSRPAPTPTEDCYLLLTRWAWHVTTPPLLDVTATEIQRWSPGTRQSSHSQGELLHFRQWMWPLLPPAGFPCLQEGVASSDSGVTGRCLTDLWFSGERRKISPRA